MKLTFYFPANLSSFTGVAILVNNEKTTGFCEVESDANRLASGVYYYRVQAGSFSKIKKMILLK